MSRSHDRPSGSIARPSADTAVGTLRLDVPTAADNAAASPSGMPTSDPLSDVLRAVRLTGALYFLVDATSPWGVEVPPADAYSEIILPRSRHVVSYHIILEGRGWTSIPGVGETWFEAGDILVFAHGDPYAMLSAPGEPPEFDAAATLRFFRAMADGELPFVVHEGRGGPERTRFVCGYLSCDIRPFNPVLATLPRLLRVRPVDGTRGGLLGQLVELTLAEARFKRAGGDRVRLGLSEVMFVEVVRRYVETLPESTPGWLSGLRDPVVGRGLTLIHRNAAHPWTLAELTEATGTSRTVLAERFARMVGCPPMQYLALWRMQLAARLLSDGVKVAATAHDVGYESEAAFSRAFKKIVGVPPTVWRDRRGAP